MNILKGFCVIPTLADNAPGVTSPFGELSSTSLTYSREKGHYSDVTYPDVSLVSFTSKNNANLLVAANPVVVAHVLNLSQYIYALYAADNIPADKAILIAAMVTAFGIGGTEYDANLVLTNINIGTMIQHPDVGQPNKRMPDFISWDMEDTVNVQTYQMTLWFHDGSFQTQYDEFEIIVIPPVNPIDGLNTASTTTANNLLSQLTPAGLVLLIESAKAGESPTILKTKPVTWVNKSNANSTLPTTWTLLIYGLAGDTPDRIEDAIVAYITANTAITMPEWEVIFPGLFAANEFYLIPVWDKIAIPEMVLEAGMYSPQIQLNKIQTIAEAFSFGYTSGEVLTTATIMTSLYRSLSVIATGNINNAAGLIRLDLKYPDIIAVPTSSIDFNKMSPDTQGFVNYLMSMFVVAESATPSSLINPLFSKVTKGGYLYIAGQYGDTDLFMVTKFSFTSNP